MNSAVDSVVALRAQPGAETEASKAKILLVDDEPKSLYALQELLSTLGETLMTAPSGEEALRLALKNDFAVILLERGEQLLQRVEALRLVVDEQDLRLREARRGGLGLALRSGLRALDADHLGEFAHPTSWWRTA